MSALSRSVAAAAPFHMWVWTGKSVTGDPTRCRLGYGGRGWTITVRLKADTTYRSRLRVVKVTMRTVQDIVNLLAREPKRYSGLV
jgi:hypothetical protein